MTITTLKMLKADPGMLLKKGDIECTSILLKEGESEEGWIEIPEPPPPEPPVE